MFIFSFLVVECSVNNLFTYAKFVLNKATSLSLSLNTLRAPLYSSFLLLSSLYSFIILESATLLTFLGVFLLSEIGLRDLRDSERLPTPYGLAWFDPALAPLLRWYPPF